MNEEFLVSASHQLALITSLPFVHTARRYYRLNGSVRRLDGCGGFCKEALWTETGQTESFRGSKSRNKVSVGEPAEGSLTKSIKRKSDVLWHGWGGGVDADGWLCGEVVWKRTSDIHHACACTQTHTCSLRKQANKQTNKQKSLLTMDL